MENFEYGLSLDYLDEPAPIEEVLRKTAYLSVPNEASLEFPEWESLNFLSSDENESHHTLCMMLEKGKWNLLFAHLSTE